MLNTGDETTTIEAKRGSDLGKASLFTITSFSNEAGLGGGYLLFGVARPEGAPASAPYEVIGVPDPDKLQSDLASKCANDFNTPVRPEIAVEVLNGGKRVVIARIVEVDPNEKPIYVRKYGLPKGACRRIGSTDHHCTDDDLSRFIELGRERSYDSTVVPEATFDDIDLAAITEYRKTRLDESAEELSYNDEDLLVALGAAERPKGELKITRAGLLLFGRDRALRRLAPSARIEYILVEGQNWVPDTTQPLQSTEIRGPLLLAVTRAVSLVLQDLPRTFQLKGRALRRKEVSAIPARVIREAVVNAVMHRSYREQQPVQIIRFSNRLEIRNPGHSLVAEEQFGQPGSRTRNERIAAVLHDIGLAETKGTGIRVMRDQMREANMTVPIFRSSRQQDSFEVQLLTHHLLDDETVKWLASLAAFNLTDHDAKALLVLRELGYIDNATYRNLNGVDVLSASLALRRLRDVGLMEAQGKSTATFYVPTPMLLASISGTPESLGSKAALKPKQSLGLSGVPLQLTPELVDLLRRLGSRSAAASLIDVAIVKLCAIRPLTLAELSKYLRREPGYLTKKFMRRLVRSGTLEYLHPEQPTHPNQAYIAAPWMVEIQIPVEPKESRKKKKGQQDLF